MADATKTMSGKTVLITGATSGIGEIAALELARKGARVVLVGRDRARAEATSAMIRKESGNPEVEYLLADLSSEAEVRRLAGEIKARYPRLDVLINNAGAFVRQLHSPPRRPARAG
jgi:NAD(P)-dependent dehydrogenase (short-subunit alcohol dehydrogenase family)